MNMHPRALDHAYSTLDRVIPDESELTAGVRIEPGRSYGFFTDTTVCIGCKACEVACKEWNNLPADNVGLTGQSFDNTGALSANSWRHVAFVEQSKDRIEAARESGKKLVDLGMPGVGAPALEPDPTAAVPAGYGTLPAPIEGRHHHGIPVVLPQHLAQGEEAGLKLLPDAQGHDAQRVIHRIHVRGQHVRRML